MTDEQVINALPCLYGQEVMCKGCDFFLSKYPRCKEAVAKNALDLIKRQQAEIEQWKEEANRYQNLWCDAEKDISNAIIEAQKDFAERLKEHMCSYDLPNYHYF